MGAEFRGPASNVFSGRVTLPASATGASSLNIPHGTAPSAPVDGDAWTTTAGLYVRINGTTVGPLNVNGPASSVTTLTGLQAAVVGTSLLYARQDHQHAVAGVVDTSTNQTVGGSKTFSSQFNVASTGDAAGFSRYSASANGPAAFFNKSRNASVGAHTVVQNSDILGAFIFSGSDGTNFQQAAAIYGTVHQAGTISSTSMPGKLEFRTAGAGSVSPTTRLTIERESVINAYLPVYIDTSGLGGSSIGNLNAGRLWLGDGGTTPSTYNGPGTAGGGLTADSSGIARLWSHNGTTATLVMSAAATNFSPWVSLNPLAGIAATNGFGGGATFTLAANGATSITPTADVVALTLERGTDSTPTADIQRWSTAGGTPLALINSLGTFKPLAGTTAAASIQYTSGSLLSSVADGAQEYTGKAYFSTLGTTQGRALDVKDYLVITGADQTIASPATAFGVLPAASDTITLAAATTYQFEVFCHIQSTGTTSNGLRFGISGSATWLDTYYMVHVDQNATSATTMLNSATYGGWVNGVTGQQAISSAVATATYRTVRITGTLRVNASGTFSPQFQFSAAPGGTTTIIAGATVRVRPVGAATDNTADVVGAWS